MNIFNLYSSYYVHILSYQQCSFFSLLNKVYTILVFFSALLSLTYERQISL